MAKIKQDGMIESKTNIVSITIDGVEYVAKNGIISIPEEYAWALEIHG